VATRTEDVERSAIREMFDLAQQYDDKDLVHLEIGEPDFDTPPHISRAAADAVEDGATHYTSNAGLPDLRRAIAADVTSEHRYDPETEILVTAGAMEALTLAFLTLVNAGDEVVVPTPAWPNYRTQTEMVGGELVEVPLDSEAGYALDSERVIDAINDDTAVVVLTTPSNPTGQVYDATATDAVVAAAAEHDATVVADEVYKDLVYDGDERSIVDTTDHPEHVVTLGSCSKTYAMTGWRVGWFAASSAVVEAATKFHESIVACAPTVSQHAAIEALTGDQEPIREMREAFERRRDFLVERVAEIPGVSCPRPDGAFYAFLDVSAVDADSVTIAERLLKEYGVVTAPGAGFGDNADGQLRVSFANDEARIAEGLDRIEQFLAAEGTR
jgi:aspartate aminotransferase